MASQKMIDTLNEQINKEMFSSYLYLSMSSYFSDKNLTGMAAWMKAQSAEETMHAMKIYDFVQNLGGKVILKKIDEPKNEWDSPKAAFEDALEHEKFISRSINEIIDLAISEKDHATHNFLGWFVTEQVEEEATASEIVDKFELIGDNKGGLYMLDRELGSRGTTGE
ncbi:MAG: ferritin [Melioribacteraceae bacterium]|nr:ferritin [Melioribacteraceae bacterium]